MSPKDRQTLLAEMDAARSKVEALVPQIEGHLDRQIYPGWTIKEFLAVTGMPWWINRRSRSTARVVLPLPGGPVRNTRVRSSASEAC